VSMAAVVALLYVWHPKRIWGFEGHEPDREARGQHGHSAIEVVRAWVPWVILSVLVFLWGLPSVKAKLDKISVIKIPIAGLHNLILRVPPVVAKPTAEGAIFNFNWLSATGTGICVAAIIAGFVMGYGPVQLIKQYGKSFYKVRFSLITISAMMAIGYMTRYGGLDATMGLAFARTGMFYPFFGTLLGWRDGEDDRCTEHRGSQHGNGVVWARGRHSPLRVFSQYRAGLFSGRAGFLTGLRVSVHKTGDSLRAL